MIPNLNFTKKEIEQAIESLEDDIKLHRRLILKHHCDSFLTERYMKEIIEMQKNLMNLHAQHLDFIRAKKGPDDVLHTV